MPELLVTGLPPGDALSLLNIVAQYMVDEVEPAPGDIMTFPNSPSAEFVRLTAPDVHMGWAVAFHGGPIRALQVVWRDEDSHTPWCPDFNQGGPRQPVLGMREPLQM